MNIKEKLRDPFYAKLFGTILIATLLLITLLVSSINSSDKKSSKTVSEYFNPNSKVTLVNGGEIYKFLGSVRYLNLRKDLRTIASKQSLNDNLLSFKIDKINKKSDKDGIIKFEGFYLDTKTRLSFEITKKPNDRQKQIITNLSSKEDLSSFSPSNSNLNSYIETLPVAQKDYLIEYTAINESITITLSTKESGIYKKVYEEIKNKITDGSFEESKIKVLYPTEL